MPVQPLSYLPVPLPAEGDSARYRLDRRRATDSADRGRQPCPDDALPGRNLLAHRRHHRLCRRHPGPYRPDPAESEHRRLLARLRGRGPTTHSRYRADSWSAVPHLQTRAHEAEVDWILRNSYPTRSTTQLSHALRAAGYPLGQRNIAEHEAIAGTQAAIWRFTNGLELDDRPLNVPVRLTETDDAVTVEFDGKRQLADYSASVSSRNGAVLTLQKSADGLHWQDVAASKVMVGAGVTEIAKPLGVGSTVADSGHGSGRSGYQHYRLTIDGDATVSGLAFRLDSSRGYRNSEAVVYLYNYLLSGAAAAERLLSHRHWRHPRPWWTAAWSVRSA